MAGILSALIASVKALVGVQNFNLTTNGFTLNANGTITPGAFTANPAQWFYPTTAAIGSSFWINITRTGGTPGVSFSAAQGSWVSMSALTVAATGGAGGCQGTYQISSSATGSPVVAYGNLSVNNTF